MSEEERVISTYTRVCVLVLFPLSNGGRQSLPYQCICIQMYIFVYSIIKCTRQCQCLNIWFIYFRQKGEPLPSLPVPQLETTMQKYLAQVEAICPSHLDKCKLLVKAFLAGPGPKLQQQLLEHQQTTINWVNLLNFIILWLILQ